MVIYRDIENLNVKRSVVTVGSFDGVHSGHKELLQHLTNLAQQHNGQSVVVTFWPHPRQVLDAANATPFLLNTIDEKLILLEKAGVDAVVLLPFDQQLSQMQASDFVNKIIIGKLGAQYLVMGQDHHFGKDRSGNVTELSTIAADNGIGVEVVELKKSGSKISSSAIRKALHSGNLEFANEMLGYEYSISGKVIQGNHLGHTIGFPTANISPPGYKLIPKEGVYRVKIHIDGSISESYLHLGMMYIGKRPVLKQKDETTHIEVNIFDFDRQIYGQNLTLALTHRIRDDIRFENMEQLAKQLNRDKQTIINIKDGTSHA